MPPQPHRLRLLAPENGEPVLEIQALEKQAQAYCIHLANGPVNSSDPTLYHKTTHRQVYERAKAEFPDHDDVLLWNERNEITESCIANVVLEMDGTLVTPPVSSGLLAGIYRAHMLAQGKLQEQVIKLEDVQRCSRIFLINSVRGMWEVSIE